MPRPSNHRHYAPRHAGPDNHLRHVERLTRQALLRYLIDQAVECLIELLDHAPW